MQNKDEIRIKGLKIYAYHGVLDSEKEKGQTFLVDITMRTNLSKAGISDDLNATINYADVCLNVTKTFTSRKFDLIEAAAEATAESILLNYPLCESVSVEVFKPEAPIHCEFGNVSVYITRTWSRAFISVGSNIGDGPATIDKAKELLFADPKIRLTKEATLISTKPYGYEDQADFTNGMWEINTLYSPEELLEGLHKVENALGRERKIHWGPRTIDLDIVYYDDLIMNTGDLTIPHVDMHNRAFVLEPLKELDPFIKHPVTGKTAPQMLSELG